MRSPDDNYKRAVQARYRLGAVAGCRQWHGEACDCCHRGSAEARVRQPGSGFAVLEARAPGFMVTSVTPPKTSAAPTS